MVSEVRDWHSRHHIMVSECAWSSLQMLDNFTDDKLDLYFLRNCYRVFAVFHCVILDLEDSQFSHLFKE